MIDKLTELEEFYKDKQGSLVVASYETIEDLKVFSDAHLQMVRHNKDKPWFDVYLNRLLKVKQILENDRG